MDWSDNTVQSTFRDDVRNFITTRLPDRYQGDSGEGEELSGAWQADRKSEDAIARGAAEKWAGALSEKGWVAPAWPKEYGGAGLTVMEQFIFNQEMAEADDLVNFYRIPPDLRDLNYGKYVEEGNERISHASDYNSHNTERLDVEGMKKMLMKLTFVRAAARGEYVTPEE